MQISESVRVVLITVVGAVGGAIVCTIAGFFYGLCSGPAYLFALLYNEETPKPSDTI